MMVFLLRCFVFFVTPIARFYNIVLLSDLIVAATLYLAYLHQYSYALATFTIGGVLSGILEQVGLKIKQKLPKKKNENE